jgi:peptidoglycan/LPS O-acetylase OafA/YrhL
MITLQLLRPQSVWSNPKLKSRIPELDGIRGLAILLVLIEHYISDAPHLNLARWQAYALIPFRLAWSGVDLFFVLSGFLIGGILIDARGATNYYATFYARRVHRIFPLYYLWFLLFLIGLPLSSTVNEGSGRMLFNRDLPIWSYPIFFQNFAMSLRRGTGPMWLGITWSLAVEEQFYVILPWAIRKLSNRGILRLAGAAIIVAPRASSRSVTVRQRSAGSLHSSSVPRGCARLWRAHCRGGSQQIRVDMARIPSQADLYSVSGARLDTMLIDSAIFFQQFVHGAWVQFVGSVLRLDVGASHCRSGPHGESCLSMDPIDPARNGLLCGLHNPSGS